MIYDATGKLIPIFAAEHISEKLRRVYAGQVESDYANRAAQRDVIFGTGLVDEHGKPLPIPIIRAIGRPVRIPMRWLDKASD